MSEELRKLREMLAPGEEQPWQDHEGKGRPHPPKSFVQIETRDGKKLAMTSAFVRWPWVEPEELQGYVDDPDPANDVLRWRFAKEPPSAIVLATHVPALLDRIEALEVALKPFASASEAIDAQDPGFPDDGCALRPSFDWYTRDEQGQRTYNSVRAKDLRLARATLAGGDGS
jgi:hypothetical protein